MSVGEASSPRKNSPTSLRDAPRRAKMAIFAGFGQSGPSKLDGVHDIKGVVAESANDVLKVCCLACLLRNAGADGLTTHRLFREEWDSNPAPTFVAP